MNDMDEQSVSLGGKSTFFAGKFEKYSWKNLMKSKTSGSDRLELYKDAIEKIRKERPGSIQSDVQELAISYYEKYVRN